MKPARRGGGSDLLRGTRAHALGGRRRHPASGTGTSDLEPKDADSLEYSDQQTRLGIPSLKRESASPMDNNIDTCHWEPKDYFWMAFYGIFTYRKLKLISEVGNVPEDWLRYLAVTICSDLP